MILSAICQLMPLQGETLDLRWHAARRGSFLQAHAADARWSVCCKLQSILKALQPAICQQDCNIELSRVAVAGDEGNRYAVADLASWKLVDEQCRSMTSNWRARRCTILPKQLRGSGRRDIGVKHWLCMWFPSEKLPVSLKEASSHFLTRAHQLKRGRAVPQIH